MRLNLSSQIVLNKVPLAYYKPKTTVEYSEISRMEKIHTDIFASSMEGAAHVADQIEKEIKAAQHEGKYYVMALGTGLSLTPRLFESSAMVCPPYSINWFRIAVIEADHFVWLMMFFNISVALMNDLTVQS
jgi:glucosamine-6-phosphate deaminase